MDYNVQGVSHLDCGYFFTLNANNIVWIV